MAFMAGRSLAPGVEQNLPLRSLVDSQGTASWLFQTWLLLLPI